MELSQDILIDVLLNVIGYVTAGALWMVLYTTMSRRPRTAVAPAAQPVAQPERRIADNGRSAQFVNLNGGHGDHAMRTSSAETPNSDQQQRQRNRAEVMRLAREMLQSGTSKEHVRGLLPISEGELALLADKQRA